MSATWAAILVPAVIALGAGLFAALRGAYARGAATGRRDGKIDEAIALLSRITDDLSKGQADHEARLRAARL